MMPREKLIKFGAETLADHELLAIYLRTGLKNKPVLQLAQGLISEFGSLYNLMNADINEFCNKKGLGVAKYCQLKSVLELSKRYLQTYITDDNNTVSNGNIENYLINSLTNKEHELFMVIFLSSDKKIICDEIMFSGSINSVDIYPREIVKKAIKYNSSYLIIAHNHPSGDLSPSYADKEITYKIIEACSLFDITILDHYIIANLGLFSFNENKLL